MSLINDALKRAQQAQETAPRPASSAPALRPADPARGARPGGALVLPGVTAVLAVCALFFGWRSLVRHPPPSAVRPAEFEARESTAPGPARLSPSAEAPKGPAENLPAPPPATLSLPATVAAVAVAGTPAAPTPVAALAAEPTPAVKRAPLKLQGIVFNPSNPAAIIDGKMLFIGDQLGDWRIIGITKETTTLAGAGQTNVLALPQ